MPDTTAKANELRQLLAKTEVEGSGTTISKELAFFIDMNVLNADHGKFIVAAINHLPALLDRLAELEKNNRPPRKLSPEEIANELMVDRKSWDACMKASGLDT